MPTRRSLNAIFCSLLACSAYEAAAQLPVRRLELGPGLDDRLWGLQPDGGMVRWVGTVMEYEGPAWSTR